MHSFRPDNYLLHSHTKLRECIIRPGREGGGPQVDIAHPIILKTSSARVGFGMTTRAGVQRRDLRVLAILYDGGKAAEEEPRLLGTTENKLGIADWLKERGHELVVTSDKEGPNSVFQKELADAEVLITTPFHPGYLTADLIKKAPKLKLCITAGVGSDHVDLNAANEKKITVAEVSGSNVVSMIERGDWNVSQIARNAYDLEGKVVGTIGAGRIGYRVLERLVPFNCKELLYFDYNALPEDAAKSVGARRVEDIKEFVAQCDVVTVNAPLHEGTRGLINADLLKHFKKGAWIVNTARGAIVDRHDLDAALKSGHINGYAGDVWDIQPAPKDHPWRTSKNPLGGGNGMVPHYSGTTLDAQLRYAQGTKSILENYLDNKPQDPGNLIVENGQYATRNYGQRK
ncbi:D-isomer specific 2-hydroxyacid dehydrogenase [Rhizoctonia solani]|nr:D-isomer specific 2-hydroxyacid dehydrogenase [Rhizoctonia solani]